MTCALLRAFQRRGLDPCAFKCGPDYIDPMFHREVLGLPSRNLDLFFSGEDQARALLSSAGRGRGVAVLEGVMGCYDGFFGPGAGTFLMLAFTGLCKFDLLTASGNTKVANSASNVASLVTFALAGQVVWSVGIPAAICGIAGGYVGSGLALKNGAKVIRPMFFVVLALLTIRLIYDLLFS